MCGSSTTEDTEIGRGWAPTLRVRRVARAPCESALALAAISAWRGTTLSCGTVRRGMVVSVSQLDAGSERGLEQSTGAERGRRFGPGALLEPTLGRPRGTGLPGALSLRRRDLHPGRRAASAGQRASHDDAAPDPLLLGHRVRATPVGVVVAELGDARRRGAQAS